MQGLAIATQLFARTMPPDNLLNRLIFFAYLTSGMLRLAKKAS